LLDRKVYDAASGEVGLQAAGELESESLSKS
jgi:hypothetical protein